jgi:hypothetical protein
MGKWISRADMPAWVAAELRTQVVISFIAVGCGSSGWQVYGAGLCHLHGHT